MGMFGCLVVHLYPHDFILYCSERYRQNGCVGRPYSGHRHLLQPVCSQNTTKTSTGGQEHDGGGEEEEEGARRGERKDGSSGEDGGGETRAKQERGEEGGEESGEKPDEFHEEESVLHHHRHPGCPDTQLPALHHPPASERTSSSSNFQVSVSCHGYGCCEQL